MPVNMPTLGRRGSRKHKNFKDWQLHLQRQKLPALGEVEKATHLPDPDNAAQPLRFPMPLTAFDLRYRLCLLLVWTWLKAGRPANVQACAKLTSLCEHVTEWDRAVLDRWSGCSSDGGLADLLTLVTDVLSRRRPESAESESLSNSTSHFSSTPASPSSARIQREATVLAKRGSNPETKRDTNPMTKRLSPMTKRGVSASVKQDSHNPLKRDISLLKRDSMKRSSYTPMRRDSATRKDSLVRIKHRSNSFRDARARFLTDADKQKEEEVEARISCKSSASTASGVSTISTHDTTDFVVIRGAASVSSLAPSASILAMGSGSLSPVQRCTSEPRQLHVLAEPAGSRRGSSRPRPSVHVCLDPTTLRTSNDSPVQAVSPPPLQRRRANTLGSSDRPSPRPSARPSGQARSVGLAVTAALQLATAARRRVTTSNVGSIAPLRRPRSGACVDRTSIDSHKRKIDKVPAS